MQMTFRPGDMQWVHNHTMLHDRTEFEDWPEPERKRHLLRLWLAVPGARPLPQIYAERFGKVDIGDRGGIIVPGAGSTRRSRRSEPTLLPDRDAFCAFAKFGLDLRPKLEGREKTVDVVARNRLVDGRHVRARLVEPAGQRQAIGGNRLDMRVRVRARGSLGSPVGCFIELVEAHQRHGAGAEHGKQHRVERAQMP